MEKNTGWRLKYLLGIYFYDVLWNVEKFSNFFLLLPAVTDHIRVSENICKTMIFYWQCSLNLCYLIWRGLDIILMESWLSSLPNVSVVLTLDCQLGRCTESAQAHRSSIWPGGRSGLDGTARSVPSWVGGRARCPTVAGPTTHPTGELRTVALGSILVSALLLNKENSNPLFDTISE